MDSLRRGPHATHIETSLCAWRRPRDRCISKLQLARRCHRQHCTTQSQYGTVSVQFITELHIVYCTLTNATRTQHNTTHTHTYKHTMHIVHNKYTYDRNLTKTYFIRGKLNAIFWVKKRNKYSKNGTIGISALHISGSMWVKEGENTSPKVTRGWFGPFRLREFEASLAFFSTVRGASCIFSPSLFLYFSLLKLLPLIRTGLTNFQSHFFVLRNFYLVSLYIEIWWNGTRQ